MLRRHQTAPFSPADITGLSLWLKADAGVTLSGSNVTAWADQSGNARNATATDTPTLTTISGKTFVDFAGGYLSGNEVLSQPYATIMAVANFTSLREVEAIFEQVDLEGGYNMVFYRGHFGANSIFAIYNGASFGSIATTNNNQTYLFGVTVDGAFGSLYLNATADEVGDSGEFTPSGPYNIGRFEGQSATTTEMRMAEIVVYNRVLTTPERQQVEAYLNAKYAIY